MTHPHPDITLAATLLHATATRVTAALDHYHNESRLNDGYPTNASGSDTGNRGGGQTIIVDGERIPVTATEAAAFAAARIHAHRADLQAMITGVVRMANNIAAECDRVLGRRDYNAPRCSSAGREGALEWGDPLCANYASRGKICDRCAKREYRFRAEHGLPRRDGGPFTGGDAAA